MEGKKRMKAYAPVSGNRLQVRLYLCKSAIIEAFGRDWAGKNCRAGCQQGKETDDSHV